MPKTITKAIAQDICLNCGNAIFLSRSDWDTGPGHNWHHEDGVYTMCGEIYPMNKICPAVPSVEISSAKVRKNVGMIAEPRTTSITNYNRCIHCGTNIKKGFDGWYHISETKGQKPPKNSGERNIIPIDYPKPMLYGRKLETRCVKLYVRYVYESGSTEVKDVGELTGVGGNFSIPINGATGAQWINGSIGGIGIVDTSASGPRVVAMDRGTGMVMPMVKEGEDFRPELEEMFENDKVKYKNNFYVVKWRVFKFVLEEEDGDAVLDLYDLYCDEEEFPKVELAGHTHERAMINRNWRDMA